LTGLSEATDADFSALIAGNDPGGMPVADGGIESAEVLSMLQSLAHSVRQVFSPAAWLVIEDGTAAGLISLLGPPDQNGAVAIGYGIAPACRNMGIGTRAVAALAAWGRSHTAVSAMTAETAVSNAPSQAVLSANGFVRTGERHDEEDGALYLWRLNCD
jgi:RimJ/RimL family protein N-acetyltransferase